jgi:putative Holliday junction resolvase
MRVLGIDYGTVRLGIAVSDDLGMIATGRETIKVQSMPEAIEKTVEVVQKYDAERVVVGLPLNMDGSSSAMSEAVQVFVERLGKKVDLPIETWDERMTSQEAERVLIEADVSRTKRKKVIDKMAAQAILQSWLDAHYTPL